MTRLWTRNGLAVDDPAYCLPTGCVNPVRVFPRRTIARVIWQTETIIRGDGVRISILISYLCAVKLPEINHCLVLNFTLLFTQCPLAILATQEKNGVVPVRFASVIRMFFDFRQK